jgi:hypothetical protein
VRFVDFLRTAVLLFGASASALAVVAVVGAGADDDLALIYVGFGWWAVAAAVGAWLGRRAEASAGTARMMAGARATTALPELEPGTVLFNRLWTLAAFTVVSGALAFVFPQVPATAVGFPLMAALAWRKQAAAVTAVEERDGVRFYIERTSPFKPTQLVRTPGFRKVGERIDEPVEREPAR